MQKYQIIKNDIDFFYKLIEKLEMSYGGKRLASACDGKLSWPQKGIYFFYEPNEFRINSNVERVVRVGTHGVSKGSKSTLWNRLKTHIGTRNGSGNHRGSIFRLHVGAALCAKYNGLYVNSWGVGQSAPKEIRKSELEIEQKVSNHIGKMKILWLAVSDASSSHSDRAYLEKNIIGLLSQYQTFYDPPSETWLGLFSPDERIKKSGLWNLNYLGYEYDRHSLNILEEYVNISVNNRALPVESIAPKDWHI